MRLGSGEGRNSQSLGNNRGPLILTLLVNGIPAYNLTSKVNSRVLNFMGTWGLKASIMAVNSTLTCFSEFPFILPLLFILVCTSLLLSRQEFHVQTARAKPLNIQQQRRSLRFLLSISI